jgi:hypothetical protein
MSFTGALFRSAAFPPFQLGNMAGSFPGTPVLETPLSAVRPPLAVREPFATETSALAPVQPTLLYAREFVPALMAKPLPLFACGNSALQSARGAVRVASFANFA